MRKESKVYLFLVFTLVILFIGLSGTGVAFARASSEMASSHKVTSSTCSGWSVVPSPTLTTGYNELYGVAANSASDAWAVGHYVISSGNPQTLIEHWNGTNWSVVSSPNGPGANTLVAVTAVSTSDAWAVGSYSNGSVSNFQTLIEHWNGTSWSVVPSPNIGSNDNELNGVTAVSASDVWAVGQYDAKGFTYGTLIEHWNGTSWSIVSSPNVFPASNDLSSVVAVSANDVWAVGDYTSLNNGADQTLTEQWNGTSWSIVSSPNIGNGPNDLYGVAATAASDVWAVGQYEDYSTAVFGTLIEHWNGTNWSVVASPNLSNYDYLESVAAVSTNDVWAVGYNTNNGYGGRTMIEHWNGTSWSIVPSPNVPPSANFLYSVAAVSASNVIAVGYYGNTSLHSEQPLIESYC